MKLLSFLSIEWFFLFTKRLLIISIVILMFLLFNINRLFSQSVRIGNGTTNNSAQLEVVSTNKGFLPPRMTLAQRNSIINPAAGLMIFCTDCEKGEMQFYNGTTWMQMKVSLYLPTVVTGNVSNITDNTATFTGNVITDGGAAVTSRGICWSENPDPTIDLSTKTSDGAGKGNFTSELTGLIKKTRYYVRAYATNRLGTVYGATKIFTAEFRNKYDGVYEVTGSFQDLSNATFTGRYPSTYYLITTGQNSVDVCMFVNGEIVPAYLFNAGSNGSYYGRWGLQAFFNTATNDITEIRNYYGDPANPSNFVGDPSGGTGAPNYAASNSRRAVLDPTGINSYDPITKTIKIKYFMLQPTIVPSGPRCLFDETWKYVGPRD